MTSSALGIMIGYGLVASLIVGVLVILVFSLFNALVLKVAAKLCAGFKVKYSRAFLASFCVLFFGGIFNLVLSLIVSGFCEYFSLSLIVSLLLNALALVLSFCVICKIIQSLLLSPDKTKMTNKAACLTTLCEYVIYFLCIIVLASVLSVSSNAVQYFKQRRENASDQSAYWYLQSATYAEEGYKDEKNQYLSCENETCAQLPYFSVNSSLRLKVVASPDGTSFTAEAYSPDGEGLKFKYDSKTQQTDKVPNDPRSGQA